MDSTSRRYHKANPDAYPTLAPNDREGLPFAADAADASMAPDVQANGRAATNGQAEGPAESVAGRVEAEADPFDLDSLRLSQDFASAVEVQRPIVTVPVRKPTTKGAFIRTHRDPGFWFNTKLLEMDDGADRDSYLVDRRLWEALDGEPLFASFLLVPCMSRPGNVLYLMKIRLPGPDGRTSEWTRSALEAVDIAKTRWVRIVSRMELGGYQPEPAGGNLPDPVWPEMTLKEILRVAFRDRVISDWNHPVLRRLRGEV
jgi:hypothetical protein